MTFRKSGLLSLVLGLSVIGATACGDTVTIPPTPDPITTISITPSAPIALQVGQQATVSAVIAGGGATTVRTVSYASSVPAVATVNPQTGVVTAVAPGTTTIVATSTADANLRASVQVTVTAAPGTGPVTPTTISISRILQGGTNVPVNINNVQGQIDVVLNVDAPTQTTVQRVEVLIDGVVACTQTFTAGAQQDGLASAQVPVEIVCSVNTAAVNAQGVPLYQTGMRTVSARAIGPAGNTLATAVSRQLNFANVNMVVATIETQPTPGTPASAPDAQGFVWREGNVIVTARPAIFTGTAAVERITICVTPQDGPGAGTSSCQTSTGALTNNQFVATFLKGNTLGGTTNGVAGVSTTDLRVTVNTIVGGEQGPGLIAPIMPAPVGGQPMNVGPSIRLDNAAPAPAPAIGPIGGTWVGRNFAFDRANVTGLTAEQLQALDVVPGVGGVQVTFHVFRGTEAQYTALGANDNARLAAVVAQGTQVMTGADLAGTTASAGNILVVRTRDAVGNESFARVAGQFGVDVVDPVFNFTEAAVTGSPANQSVYRTAPPAFQFSFPFVEGNVSGTNFNPEVQLIRYTSNPAQTRCINPNDGTVTTVPTGGCPWVQAVGATVTLPFVDGYYEATFRFRDNAGNTSAPQTRTVLIDATAPTVTTGAFAIDGNTVTLAGSMTDNVALRGWDLRMRFTGAAAPVGATTADLPVTAVTSVATFGVANRLGTFSIPSQSTTVWRSLRVTDEGTGALGAQSNADGVGFGAWDIARNFNSAFLTIGGQEGAAAPAGLTNLTISFTPAGTLFCNGLSPRPSGDQGLANCATAAPATPVSRVATATAVGPVGFVQPFTAVHFYRVDPQGNVWFLGTSMNVVSGSIGAQFEHRWTFDVNATGWQGSFAANDQRIFAVGVTSARDAIRSPSAAITVQGAANQP